VRDIGIEPDVAFDYERLARVGVHRVEGQPVGGCHASSRLASQAVNSLPHLLAPATETFEGTPGAFDIWPGGRKPASTCELTELGRNLSRESSQFPM
jgi:hypothetical protein